MHLLYLTINVAPFIKGTACQLSLLSPLIFCYYNFKHDLDKAVSSATSKRWNWWSVLTSPYGAILQMTLIVCKVNALSWVYKRYCLLQRGPRTITAILLLLNSSVVCSILFWCILSLGHSLWCGTGVTLCEDPSPFCVFVCFDIQLSTSLMCSDLFQLDDGFMEDQNVSLDDLHMDIVERHHRDNMQIMASMLARVGSGGFPLV